MRLHDLIFLIVDTETTGLDPAEDQVVELGAATVRNDRVEPVFHSLVNPGIPIPPEKSAIHGIADWHVADKSPLDVEWHRFEPLVESADCLVAHHASFDRSFLPHVEGKPWLDTKRFAQHLWPYAPNHRNQTLRYWKGLRLNSAAHSADGDALVTAHLLVLMIRDYLAQGHPDSLEGLISYAESPIFVNKMPFPLHENNISEIDIHAVPHDYLRWVLANVLVGVNLTPDLKWSIESVLKGGDNRDRSTGA